MSKGPRCRPTLLVDSRSGHRACGFDKLSRATRDRVRGPAGSTSSLGRLELGSEGPLFRLALPGGSGPFPRARGFEQLSGQLRPTSLDLRCRPAAPGDSGQGPRSCTVDEHSWATCTRVRGPAGSTSTPGRLALRSERPRDRPDLLGYSGPGPMAHKIDQIPREPHAQVRWPTGWSSSPGRLAIESLACGVDHYSWVTRARVRGPAGLTSSPGLSGLGPMARRVDQLSRRTRGRL